MPDSSPKSKSVKVQYLVGDHVQVDGEIKALVVQISIRHSGVSYECSWWHNGASLVGWFDEWRLEPHEEWMG